MIFKIIYFHKNIKAYNLFIHLQHLLYIYNMLLPSNISPIIHHTLIKCTPTWVIAPHGITDYIHAKKYELLPALYKINLAAVAATLLAHMSHCDNLIHYAFMGSAVIHFRNDMPNIGLKNKEKLGFQLLCSTGLVFIGPIIKWNIFLYYMLFIHVPNHYKMSYDYVKDHMKETVSLVIGFAILLNSISYNPLESVEIDWLSKSLVIAHIAYEELYIFDEVPKLITKTKDFFELLPYYYNK